AEVQGEGTAGPQVAVCDKARGEFEAALCDDLNTPEALAAVPGLVSEGNSLLAAGEVTREGAALLRRSLADMDAVFAVLMPSDDDTLSPREQAVFDERQ